MKITKLIPVFVAIVATLIFTSCKQSKVEAAQSNIPAKQAQLDIEAVKKNMSLRVNSILAKKQDAKAKNSNEPIEDILIGTDSIIINKVYPVQLGELTLFGIKMSVRDAAKFGLPQNTTFTTDPTGTLIMPFVGLMSTGKDAIFPKPKAAPLPTSIPEEMTSLLMKGEGTADVVFLTDPFCFYCRKGFDYLMKNKDKIGSLRIAHMPSSSRPGGDVAAWVLAYAIENDLGAQAVFEFSYSALEAPKKAKDIKEAGTIVLAQFMGRFPELYTGSSDDFFKLLATKYALKVANGAQKLQRMGFTSTPYFQIDGEVVRGFNPDNLNKKLGS